MSDMEYVMDFAVELARQMILCGANLERVNTTIYQICKCYGLHSISIFSLNSILIVSARTSQGIYVSRQVSVPAFGIHLEQLKKLNQLSYQVCREKTMPGKLGEMLKEAQDVKTYSENTTIIGYLIAIGCLCMIFGGSWRDVIATDFITLILVKVMKFLGRPGVNRIIINAVSMWLATTLAILSIKIGIGKNVTLIIMSLTMVVLPGIPLVNAVRNLFCDNEMNGILQLFRVLLETIAMVVGLYISTLMFGGMIQW